MTFSTKTYDTLKWIALIALPAVAVLYLGLGSQWGWDRTEEIVGSITLIDAFLGAVLQISSKQFKNSPDAVDGYLNSESSNPDTNIPDLKMTITRHPEELLGKKTVTLKVGTPPSTPTYREPIPELDE